MEQLVTRPVDASLAPRRPARTGDLWMRRSTWRWVLGTAALLAVVGAAWPAYAWIEHSVNAAAAYTEGRSNAQRAIAGAYLVVDGVRPVNMEVFVDPVTGLQTSEPMLCCVIEEFDEYRRRGFDDEVARAFGAGELAQFDLRPRVRTEAEVLRLFDEHAERVFDISAGGGTHAAEGSDVHLVWEAQTDESPWSSISILRTGAGEAAVMTAIAQAPARALFVDDGTTLLLIEKTTAVQILDVEHRARLAWYGGWMSPSPRN